MGLLFTVGEVTSLVFEPLIGLWSDRGSKRLPVLAGTILLAFGFGLIALAPSLPWLLLAIALIWPATGMAVGLAQATLVDIDPEDAPRTMTRATISAGVGDLAAPAIAAGMLAVGLGWRPLFWIAAGLWIAQALLLWGQRFPDPPHTDPDRSGTWRRSGADLWAALRVPTLVRWMGVATLSVLLDEMFLGFAGIYLADVVGMAPAAIGLAIGAGLAGSMIGLLVVDRLAPRLASSTLLRPASVLVLVGLGGLLLARSGWAATATLFVIGFGTAAWYPVASGEVYRLLPGRSGTVHALSVILIAPVGLAVPPLVGLVAGSRGILAGMAVLAAAPLLALLALPGKRTVSPRRRSP